MGNFMYNISHVAEQVKQSAETMEKEFVQLLKELENESSQLESRAGDIQIEKQSLIDEIVEGERQVNHFNF